MNRFASPILKVEFEGPDVHIEDLWELFRVRAFCLSTMQLLISNLNQIHSPTAVS